MHLLFRTRMTTTLKDAKKTRRSVTCVTWQWNARGCHVQSLPVDFHKL